MCMLTIGSENIICGLDRRDGTYSDRLLPIVQVEKSTNLPTRVGSCRFLFKATNTDHVAVKRQHQISVHDNSSSSNQLSALSSQLEATLFIIPLSIFLFHISLYFS